MSSMMKLDENGQALVKAFESCLRPIGGGYFRAYYCPANVLTIGWGSTRADAPHLKEGEVWSQAKCDAVFAASLGKYEQVVNRLNDQRIANGHPSLNQNQFNAITSLVYNAGGGSVSGLVGAAIREGRDTEVPAALARWNKGGGRVLKGLVRRRKAESEMWSGDLRAAARTAETILPGTMPQKASNVQTGLATAQEKPKTTVATTFAAVTTAAVAVAHAVVSTSWNPWLIGGGVLALIGVGIGCYALFKHHRKVTKES